MSISIRGYVIGKSVEIESLISALLAKILNINVSTTKVFGNSSKALSIRSKVDILLEVPIIDSNDAKIINGFFEIRNLFAHTAECDSYLSCYHILEQRSNKNPFNSFIGEKEVTEQNLNVAYKRYCEKIYAIITQLLYLVSEKREKRAQILEYETFLLKFYEELAQSIYSSPKKAQIIIDLVDECYKIVVKNRGGHKELIRPMDNHPLIQIFKKYRSLPRSLTSK